MEELLRSNDIVYLGWVEALLKDASVPYVVLDRHTSSIEGSIGAIPRRVLVDSDHLARAQALIAEETDDGP